MQTQALVLRAAEAKESDRLITALSSERGVLRAFANGARKPKSPLHAGTQPFSYGTLELAQRRDTYSVTGAQVQGVFFDGLAAELSRLALANYFAALCAELAPREEPAPAHLRLLLNALQFLSEGTRPQLLLKATVELRLLLLAGYMPNLEAEPRGTGYLDCANGVLSARPGPHCVPLPPAARAAMAHICAAPLERAFRFALPEQALRELSSASQAYLRYQTGRRFEELRYWEEISAI
ncbi:MAG: DNA repair protein RecO [Oscillospiraceae bacterium]|jgi:DNA repair protein RecO (recombination protein O)|nr:DNA repair protein RecO [Oscillospiraceae bacterium]